MRRRTSGARGLYSPSQGTAFRGILYSRASYARPIGCGPGHPDLSRLVRRSSTRLEALNIDEVIAISLTLAVVKLAIQPGAVGPPYLLPCTRAMCQGVLERSGPWR